MALMWHPMKAAINSAQNQQQKKNVHHRKCRPGCVSVQSILFLFDIQSDLKIVC